jgi:6-phosphogluconolactonase (cycloisomerase 2 family)
LSYASNRGHESIAELSFDGKSLKLLNLYSCHGVHPRDFDFVEDYIISTNMRSDNVAVMKICNGKTVLTDNIEIN